VRALLFIAALPCLGFALASTGCVFDLSGRYGTPIDVTVADDVDLTKVEYVYVRIYAPEQREFSVPKPAEGWPKEVHTAFGTQSYDPIVLTVTAYDANGALMALGHAEQEAGSVAVLLRETIPWS
jgi:hypothetical protein